MTKGRKTYSVSCGINATDNDYIKLTELRLASAQIPEFVAALRALLGGQLDVLRLNDVRQKALLSANGGTSFTLLFEDGSGAYLLGEDIDAIEAYVLGCWTGRAKAGASVSRTLYGKDGQQVVLHVRAGRGASFA